MSSEDKNNTYLNQVASSFLGSHNIATFAVAGAAILSGALYYYYNNNSKSCVNVQKNHVLDIKNQTREIENGVRINSASKDNKLMDFYYSDVTTLYELFKRAIKTSNDGYYLGSKPSTNEPYKWLRYSEVNEMIEQVGSAFLKLGLESGKESGSYVGIFAKNRVEWVVTEQACNAYSLVSVPLYDTLGIEAISFILMQTELRLAVCDDSEKALQLMRNKSSLEYLIVIDIIRDDVLKRANELNIKIISFEQLKKMGTENLKNPVPPKPNDIVTICYTSGTTGTPKGAVITHKNMISIASSMLYYIKSTNLINEGNESYLSYLPLAHMFERISQAVVVGVGGRIGFYQGDIKKLVDDMKEVKPTIFCTVPRLLNRIYAKIRDNLEKAPGYKKALFKWAFSNKESEVLRGIVRNNSFYDLAFKQIRESMGGNTKFIITGSAPISAEVLHFLRVVAGCHVLEGYGATETGGATSVQIPFETTVGNVGPPFLCSKFKLIDVPSMNLVVSRDKRGEILIGGNNIFKGYYKDEEKTKEALDEEGWYHTGDIGVFESNGTLKVVDRVKNIFKLQQGEYIAPEKIENIYVRSKYVAQIFIYGNSYKSSLIGIIVPEETVLFEWAKENDLELNFRDLCKNKELKKVILNDITQLGKTGGLKGFEQIRDLHLHHELFSIENGLLTPTMKSKRNELQKYFQAEIDELYKNAD